jgi:hypothetical protein
LQTRVVSSSEAMVLLQESITLEVLLANHGMKMPGAITLHELVNAMSNDTRELILRAQLADVLQEGWDDFEQLIQDSTAVKGNAQNL